MDDFKKAAVLLKHLRPDERDQILVNLEETQRLQLEQQIQAAPEITEAELAGIVAEYQTWLRHRDSSLQEPQEKSTEVDQSLLTIPRDMERLRDVLEVEPGTIRAAVLCHLPEAAAKELFQSFSETQQAELLLRLPEQQSLSPIVWDELSLCVREPTTGETRTHQRGKELLKELISDPDLVGLYEGRVTELEQERMVE